MSNVFQHACFISYRNKDKLLNEFAQQIFEALKSELDTYFEEDTPIFFDKEELQGGHILHAKINGAICRSVCMIVIFTSNYLSKKKWFCALELYGMLQCEAARMEVMKIKKPEYSLIIPIVLRSPEYLPNILTKRLYYDFSKFTLMEADIIANENYVNKIKEIAAYIHESYQEMKDFENDICTACEQFALPDTETAAGKQLISDFIQLNQKPYVPKLLPS